MTSDPAATLRRVGSVLVVAGLLDVAWMVYAIAAGWSYASSVGPFAVVAGVLLRRGSHGTARLVAQVAAGFLAGSLALALALPILFPRGLIETWWRTTPASLLLLSATASAVLIVLSWWVVRALGAPAVRGVIAPPGAPFRRRPEAGFAFGAGLVAALVVAFLAIGRSETHAEAVRRARELRGPHFEYYVSSLSSSWSSGRGRHVRATVLAYSERAIEPLEIEWRE